MALREIVQVAGANSAKVRDLCISENSLACFYSDHGPSPRNLWDQLDFNYSRTIRTGLGRENIQKQVRYSFG